MAALFAKLKFGGIRSTAVGTDQLQLNTAFTAEFHARWILELACSTFHGPYLAKGKDIE